MTIASSPSSAATASDAVSRVPRQALGQDDFLRLMTVQFQQQDPMKPVDDTAFIAQMAQFSALEQSQQLNREVAELRAYGQLGAATSLLGREVTFATADGEVRGVASGLDTRGAEPLVQVGEQYLPFSSLLRVAPAPAAPTTDLPA